MKAATSAMRSWLARDRRRTRRPAMTIGRNTTGTPTSTSSVSFAEVSASIAKAPIISSRLRSANEAEEPTTTSSSEVSLVRREITSPVRVTSKKLGESSRMWSNTARRMSAVTRSPSQVTR